MTDWKPDPHCRALSRPVALPLAMMLGCVALAVVPVAAQTITLFDVPANSFPYGITSGPDGNLWYTDTNARSIGRMSTAGVPVEFSFPINPSTQSPSAITTGPDGNIWFTGIGANATGLIDQVNTAGQLVNASSVNSTNVGGIAPGSDGNLWYTYFVNDQVKIGRITTFGTVTEFAMPTGTGSNSESIAAGADGNLWFTEFGGNKIGRISTAGAITEFRLPSANSFPAGITAGPDGNLWFTEYLGNKIGRITPAGVITEFPANGNPMGITVGMDGNLWFTELLGTNIGRITTTGAVTEFPVPTNGFMRGITSGPDGNVWFAVTGGGVIGRLIPPPSTSPLRAAVLPSSRSVQVGSFATAFATIINSGTTTATGCGIAPVTSTPANFSFQTTDPVTNRLTGTVNTGVNTLLLTFADTPVADMIAVGVTPSGDGFARTGGPTGTGVFAVATTNVGAAAQLTGRVRLADSSLPLIAAICETNSQTGICKATPAATVVATMSQNETATFTAFLNATGTIPADPAKNRAVFEFLDENGVVRGSTSTAVTTQ